jgi:hypothetical protein
MPGFSHNDCEVNLQLAGVFITVYSLEEAKRREDILTTFWVSFGTL